MTAPLGSATVPVTSPEMVVCVQAADAQSNKTAKPNKARAAKYVCFALPVVMVTKVLLNFRKVTPQATRKTTALHLTWKIGTSLHLRCLRGQATKRLGPREHLGYWHM